MKKFFFYSLMGLKKELLVGNGIWETTSPTDSNLATKWYLNLLNRKKITMTFSSLSSLKWS